MKANKPATVDEYIAAFKPDVQAVLQQIRLIIKEAAPEAEEVISYGIPTYKFYGSLVHFGGFKNHIGFYATPTGHEAFKEELSVYKQGKGSVQFPSNESLPVNLIDRIVKFRIRENLISKSKIREN